MSVYQTFRAIIILNIIVLALFYSASVQAAEVLIYSKDIFEVRANTAILDFDDSGGDIFLQFGNTIDESLFWGSTNDRFIFTDDLKVQGNIAMDGNDFYLDDDNVGAGADVHIIANQGADNDGIIRYNSTLNRWEFSNDGGAFEQIVSSSGSSNLAQVYAGNTTIVSDIIYAPITWDGSNSSFRIIDSNYIHSTLLLPSRLTVLSSGLYRLHYNISWQTNFNNRRTSTCDIYVNGSPLPIAIGRSHSYTRNTTDDTETNTVSVLLNFNANDYYEILCLSSGTTGTLHTNPGESWT